MLFDLSNMAVFLMHVVVNIFPTTLLFGVCFSMDFFSKTCLDVPDCKLVPQTSDSTAENLLILSFLAIMSLLSMIIAVDAAKDLLRKLRGLCSFVGGLCVCFFASYVWALRPLWKLCCFVSNLVRKAYLKWSERKKLECALHSLQRRGLPPEIALDICSLAFPNSDVRAMATFH